MLGVATGGLSFRQGQHMSFACVSSTMPWLPTWAACVLQSVTWLVPQVNVVMAWLCCPQVAGRSTGLEWVPAGRPGGQRGMPRVDGPSIKAAVEGELLRLQTDYIDLIQLHCRRCCHGHADVFACYRSVSLMHTLT
jgi:hypothetical protein